MVEVDVVLIVTMMFRLYFFNDSSPTVIYTLSLHDALPISRIAFAWRAMDAFYEEEERILGHAADSYHGPRSDRKSTRLNSSHTVISYAVFCLKKKKPT